MDVDEQRTALIRYATSLRASAEVRDALAHCSERAVTRVCEAWRRESEAGLRLELGFVAALNEVFNFSERDVLADEVLQVMALMMETTLERR